MAPWQIRHGELIFALKATESGAVGVFPEQAENWDWIDTQVRRASRPPKVLNLFAYTGGSTLSAAVAGAKVVHVDAARSAVGWARQNARLTGLEHAPIRWIVDDARKFVERELRRGSEYDAVVLDPPTYGHGPQSKSWQMNRHLPELLSMLGKLTRRRLEFVLLTCHAPDLGPDELEAMLTDTVFGDCPRGVQSKRLFLSRRDGHRLASGVVVRWCHDR
jgi:23S rRNA (cytosine1962-C5)-methyltransferase